MHEMIPEVLNVNGVRVLLTSIDIYKVLGVDMILVHKAFEWVAKLYLMSFSKVAIINYNQ